MIVARHEWRIDVDGVGDSLAETMAGDSHVEELGDDLEMIELVLMNICDLRKAVRWKLRRSVRSKLQLYI